MSYEMSINSDKDPYLPTNNEVHKEMHNDKEYADNVKIVAFATATVIAALGIVGLLLATTYATAGVHSHIGWGFGGLGGGFG